MEKKKTTSLFGDKLTAVIAFLVGALSTAGLAADWTFKWDFWGMVSGLGSILAGGGTIGLLWFGYRKAGEWVAEVKYEKNLAIALGAAVEMIPLINELHRRVHDELHQKFQSMANDVIKKQMRIDSSNLSAQDYTRAYLDLHNEKKDDFNDLKKQIFDQTKAIEAKLNLIVLVYGNKQPSTIKHLIELCENINKACKQIKVPDNYDQKAIKYALLQSINNLQEEHLTQLQILLKHKE